MSDLVERPPAGRTFEGRRTVRLADVSPAGRARLDAVARYLQDLSADDTADSDLPDAEAWVVRKTVIEVQAFPRYLESMALATWCSGTGSHWAERRIQIRGASGAVVDAATTWVHFDRTSGRPSRIPDGFHAIYGEASGGRRVKARLDHPDPPTHGPSERFGWPLRFTDFDVLAHVNNAAYWQIVEEALAARPALRAPLRAEVQHRTAVERGTSVDVLAVDQPDGALALWVRAEGVVAATAEVRPLVP